MHSRIFFALLAVFATGASTLAAREPLTLPRSNDAKMAALLREEAIERTLANLDKRCKKMLAEQITIQNGIASLHRRIEKNFDKQPMLADRETAKQLARNMADTIRETTRILDLLEKEGASVAFPEVFQQLRDDMKTVQRRLQRCDLSPTTLEIQEDIVETLREMISALTKSHSCG